MTVLDWPALGRELRPWSSSLSEFDQVEVATVPAIAVRPVVLAPATTGTTAAAHAAVRLLDDTTTVDLTALAGALLRSESVASSKIEHLEASQRDLGMAMLRGVPVHTAAAHVAARAHESREPAVFDGLHLRLQAKRREQCGAIGRGWPFLRAAPARLYASGTNFSATPLLQ